MLHDKQFELDEEQQRILKKTTQKAGQPKRDIGTEGEKMGFDEFKMIETCIVRLEERLLDELRDDQRTKRRGLLKGDKNDAYWVLLGAHCKAENMLLRKISKSVVAHYKIGPTVYQGWIETYLEKSENQAKLMKFRQELRTLTLKQRPALSDEITKEKVLEYGKKFYGKIAAPKADLLLRQARNKTTREIPWSIFGHQA